MSALDHHLVRRGVDVARHAGVLVDRANSSTPQPNPDLANPLKSGTAGIIVLVSVVLLIVVSLAIQYTYGLVVATLSCVEDPQPSVYLAVHESDAPVEPTTDRSDKKKSSPLSSSSPSPPPPSSQGVFHADLVTGQPPPPITASLRTTIQHLRARAGPWSRFRGLSIYLVWAVCRSGMASLLSGGPLGRFSLWSAVADVAAEVIMADLAVAWIHTVIAEPLAGPWWRRLPGYAVWRQVAPAAAIKAAAGQLGFLLPALVGSALNLFRVESDGSVSIEMGVAAGGTQPEQPPSALPLAGVLAVMALSLALVVLVELPATVVMIRVAASMLPDHVESIVPFDRSFGGRAVAEEGRNLGLVAAWTTFTWAARVRLGKVLLKVFAMLTSVAMLFAGVFLAVQVYVASDNKV